MLRASLWIAAVAAACGGSSEMRQLSVGGTYATSVDLLPGNTCSPPQVNDNPTVVAHAPGAQSLSLTHAGITYSGTVTPAGAFTVPPTPVGIFSISIAGQFIQSGFTATTHVAQSQPACAYDVSWVGTKSGPPNTFP